MHPSTIKHFRLARATIDKEKIFSFSCKHCNKTVFERTYRFAASVGDFELMENHLQCHLMECESQEKEKV